MAGFLTEAEPAYGVPIPVAEGIRRLVARNPGPMTYHGTNSWLVDEPGGIAVIDPGPDDTAHVAAILAGAGRPVVRILLTHTHPDHLGATAALAAATGAPVHGWPRPWADHFGPDISLANGERVGSLTALHTPGHASDHVSFARDDGVVFTGDHVMPWSTSVVSPPDGNMADYMNALRLLLARRDRLYLSGHGPALPDPLPLVRGMLNHRVAREAAVLKQVEAGVAGEAGIVDALYAGLAPHLRRAAQRSVLAHLLKLEAEGRVGRAGEGWEAVLF